MLAGMVEPQVTASYEGRSRHAYNVGSLLVPTTENPWAEPYRGGARYERGDAPSIDGLDRDCRLEKGSQFNSRLFVMKGEVGARAVGLVASVHAVAPRGRDTKPSTTESCWCTHMCATCRLMRLACSTPYSPFRAALNIQRLQRALILLGLTSASW